MFNNEQSEKLIELVEATIAKLKEVTLERDAVMEKLNTNTEIMRKGTEDIHMLLAFIRSKGLTPPKIQSDLIN